MNVDTVLAFSDGKSAAVLIPAEVKRTCLRALGYSREIIIPRCSRRIAKSGEFRGKRLGFGNPSRAGWDDLISGTPLRRGDRRKTTIALRIFAAGLYFLLKDVLEEVTLVTIDQEYPGREGDIKGMLLRLIWVGGERFDEERIAFHQVGRKSAAHFKAYGVYKGFQKADRILTAEEILTLI